MCSSPHWQVGWSWFGEKLSPLNVNKCYHSEQILWKIASHELGPRSYRDFVKKSCSLAPCTHHITSGIWWKIQHVYSWINIRIRVSLLVFVFIFVIACIRGTPTQVVELFLYSCISSHCEIWVLAPKGSNGFNLLLCCKLLQITIMIVISRSTKRVNIFQRFSTAF